jgi:hypothetical protein
VMLFMKAPVYSARVRRSAVEPYMSTMDGCPLPVLVSC